ncbi:hypothetical protein CW304_24840 [Bacillus sp. UFRGS-B20]|nr:hypothetical protein CW304_24840 [Bacillus sp. UFRGS-B20]
MFHPFCYHARLPFPFLAISTHFFSFLACVENTYLQTEKKMLADASCFPVRSSVVLPHNGLHLLFGMPRYLNHKSSGSKIDLSGDDNASQLILSSSSCTSRHNLS